MRKNRRKTLKKKKTAKLIKRRVKHVDFTRAKTISDVTTRDRCFRPGRRRAVYILRVFGELFTNGFSGRLKRSQGWDFSEFSFFFLFVRFSCRVWRAGLVGGSALGNVEFTVPPTTGPLLLAIFFRPSAP